MLALSTVQEIDRLLAEGKLSHRRIAARLGVSRASVAAIANGKRGLHGRKAPVPGPQATSAAALAARCPSCGYLVYLPCLVCAARAYQYLCRRQQTNSGFEANASRHKRRGRPRRRPNLDARPHP
jgi:hypothetical protein